MAFKEATRVSTGLLTSSERRCLIWMAARMPRRVNSDHLTALGLAAMFMVGVSYWLARDHPLALLSAIAWLAVNWFGDSLDGTLARVRQPQRPRYGFYVDHVLDTVGILFVLGGLALSGLHEPAGRGGAADCVLRPVDRGVPGDLRLGRVPHVVLEARPDRAADRAGHRDARPVRPARVVTILGTRYLLFDVGGVTPMAGLLLTSGDLGRGPHARAVPRRAVAGSACEGRSVSVPVARAERARAGSSSAPWARWACSCSSRASGRCGTSLGLHYLVAAMLAIELAALHNFVWHLRWTWGDRPGAPGDLAPAFRPVQPRERGDLHRRQPGADDGAGRDGRNALPARQPDQRSRPARARISSPAMSWYSQPGPPGAGRRPPSRASIRGRGSAESLDRNRRREHA